VRQCLKGEKQTTSKEVNAGQGEKDRGKKHGLYGLISRGPKKSFLTFCKKGEIS
jgi:hypothetical protein